MDWAYSSHFRVRSAPLPLTSCSFQQIAIAHLSRDLDASLSLNSAREFRQVRQFLPVYVEQVISSRVDSYLYHSEYLRTSILQSPKLVPFPLWSHYGELLSRKSVFTRG